MKGEKWRVVIVPGLCHHILLYVMQIAGHIKKKCVRLSLVLIHFIGLDVYMYAAKGFS